MTSALISNIQRFSTKDGPGIRTTVFLKGCPLRCKWCHNPETHSSDYEIMYNSENCTLCGRCVTACPDSALTIEDNKLITDTDLCRSCGYCTDACYYNAREISGKRMTVAEVCDTVLKDVSFYRESGGGVTFSGGECMMFPAFLCEALKSLKSSRIHTAVDTSGFASFSDFEKILPYTDLFLYDIKAYSSPLHKHLTGVGNEIIWENLIKLSAKGANINLRVPLIEGCNTDSDDLEKIAEKTSRLNIKKVNLLPYHDMGKYKYTKLSRFYEGDLMSTPTAEKLEEIKKIFEKHSFAEVKIGG